MTSQRFRVGDRVRVKAPGGVHPECIGKEGTVRLGGDGVATVLFNSPEGFWSFPLEFPVECLEPLAAPEPVPDLDALGVVHVTARLSRDGVWCVQIELDNEMYSANSFVLDEDGDTYDEAAGTDLPEWVRDQVDQAATEAGRRWPVT